VVEGLEGQTTHCLVPESTYQPDKHLVQTEELEHSEQLLMLLQGTQAAGEIASYQPVGQAVLIQEL
jgi:hypothetical protein